MKICSMILLFLFPFILSGQGTETFSNIPASATNYTLRTWTGDNGLTWTATGARTDQTINGKAITLNAQTVNQYITCENIPNGLGSLTLKHQQVFAGSNGTISIFINSDSLALLINVSTIVTETIIENINISGNFNLQLKANAPGVRVTIDDISWTAYSPIVLAEEPTHHATQFDWNYTTQTTTKLTWKNQTENPLPDQYLLVGSTINFGSILVPSDGVSYSNSLLVKNISGNHQDVLLTGLSIGTTYYFKLFPYNGSGIESNYLTNENVPTILITTLNETGATSTTIPMNYYSTATGSGATLKTQLYNIIKNHSEKTYTSLWTHFQSTDSRWDGNVFDMYSNCDFIWVTQQDGGQGVSGECERYNREHSFPASWFNDAAPMYTDLFHLYPTDKLVNAMRSNYPFGQVEFPTQVSNNGSKLGLNSFPGYSGTVFEPIDEYKGDFARSVFYMVTRYENLISGWENNSVYVDAILDGTIFPAFEEWALQLYYQWHLSDPVSKKEIERNQAIYQIQNNRNPFIDFPDFADGIWSAIVPVVLSEWTATVSNHSIQLLWKTESELNHAGFEIYRSTGEESNPIKISEPGTYSKIKANGVNGGIYEFMDKYQLIPGKVYEYELVEVSSDGTREYFPKISVRFNSDMPTEIFIHSVYPNPFNPTVNIHYELSQSGATMMEIFNQLGQLVWSSIDQHSSGGRYTKSIFLENHSTGSYVLKITQDKMSAYTRLLLIK